MKSRHKTSAPKTNTAQGRQQLRIIGGTWRGRKLSFPAIDDLRPTSDRVRETLFNWLQMEVAGTRCLDLFAGSGALGLEALSRGAAHVEFIEQDACAAQHIREHLHTLQCDKATVIAQDAFSYLEDTSTQFDLVFLDPPFRLDCLAQLCQLLTSRGWLRPGALIYIETPKTRALPKLPAHWQLLKQKQAGDVAYYLVRTT